MNNVHRTIKFTHQSSSKSISFLDILVSFTDGYLQTDIYTKPTNSHEYLPNTSCHPAHIKRIPYSQFPRLRLLCSEESQFQTRDELEKHLLTRGCHTQTSKAGRTRASSIPRKEAHMYQNKSTSTKVPFVITHHPQYLPLSKLLHELQDSLIKEDSHMSQVLLEASVCGRRNCRNLQKILMPTVLPPHTAANQGNMRCKKSMCVICSIHFEEGSSFKSCQTGEEYHNWDKFTCDTQNIIYLISCKKCNQAQYIGQWKNNERESLYLHRSHIGKDVGTPLTLHFNQKDHSFEDMKCMVIERVHGSSQPERCRRESLWISKMNTLIPNGLYADPQVSLIVIDTKWNWIFTTCSFPALLEI